MVLEEREWKIKVMQIWKDKNKCIEFLIVFVIVVGMMWMISAFETQEYEYHRYETSNIHYIKAKVMEILDQELTLTGADGEYFTGQQRVVVEFLEGDEKGQTREIDNYVTVQHNVVVKEGSYVTVCADIPNNGEAYYTIYNYYRNHSMIGMMCCFLLLIILIGRKKGFYSCLGLLFTITMVVCYLLPNLYHGKYAMIAAALTVIVSTLVSCFCIGGLSQKTIIYSVNTALGTFSAGVIYAIFSLILHINGCSLDEAESLVLISQATGLQMRGVLFAGIMITSLGAVMDVAVSIGAALCEIAEMNPDIDSKSLFRSGMNIGRDMIGTMTNTLILAFAGESVATLIVFISYGVQYNQLLSSDYLTLELAKGVAGSTAVVLTVPISACICALCYGKHK